MSDRDAGQTDLPLDAVDAIAERHERRDDWLEARRDGVGGSEAPVVIGASPYAGPFELYVAKVEGVRLSPDDEEAAAWGHILERTIAVEYGRRARRHVVFVPEFTMFRSRDARFAFFTPDAFVIDDPRGLGVVQTKNVTGWKSREWRREPPLHYQIQLQHEMKVARASWGALVALIGGNRLVWFEIERDDRFVDALLHHESIFVDRLTRNVAPPAANPAVVRAILQRRFPEEETGLSLRLPDDAVMLDAAATELDAQIAALSSLRTDARNQMMELLGPYEEGVLPDGTRWTWKTVERDAYVVPARSGRELRRFAPKADRAPKRLRGGR